VIVALYIPPLEHWFQQRSTEANARTQLHALQQEHRRLQSQLDSLSSTAGVEQAARRLGMVRRNERAYVILGSH
jgi:cell division protein FtsL